jgi:hypothetical protein
MGLPGERDSPIGRCDRDQLACPTRIPRSARLAASTAPSTSASFDMVAFDGSTGVLGMTGWLLGGDARRPGQPPPATGYPAAALAARRTSSTQQPRMGGLLLQLGHALLSQHLAQSRMLIVHGSLPLPAPQPASLSDLIEQRSLLPAQDGVVASAPNPAPAIRERSPTPYFLGTDPYGCHFAPAGRAG